MGMGRKLGVLGCLAVAGYALVVRPRLIRWGATDEELARTYPGSELIPDGQRAATMAVTIERPPAEVWPWLVQMGWERAGWYSWDCLDNGGRRSAREIHPEWQDLGIGDCLSAWSPGGPVAAWEVVALEPRRFLGLRGLSDLGGHRLDPDQPRPPAYVEGLWGFLLEEKGPGCTRLVVSGYQCVRPRWLERAVNFCLYPPVHWIMQTRQFARVKQNVESRQPEPAA